jgi:predicted Holliday junction resolvase-like endonuclease
MDRSVSCAEEEEEEEEGRERKEEEEEERQEEGLGLKFLYQKLKHAVCQACREMREKSCERSTLHYLQLVLECVAPQVLHILPVLNYSVLDLH